ncbi:hypothetical protein WA026_017420 [Henosepilachna vigintioctopunctata]|uniref:PiggyBac transposable element-derived protein domain-containing protein n=1 Tax=Henosepilachna vigintioctopunctata TaxID=420089 RepID=A0AAW1VFZ5_9CUCU
MVQYGANNLLHKMFASDQKILLILRQEFSLELDVLNVKRSTGTFLFDNEMLDAIFNNTNSRIRVKTADCQDPTKNNYMKECDHNELMAFFGLLFIAGVQRSGRQNLSDLWV